MKSSYAALGVLGLALGGLWYAGGGTAVPPAPAAASEQVRVSAPLAHDNLTVYFVHGPDAVADAKIMTLQEALEAGLAVVHETGNVNTLAVENLSPEYELFIQDGEMIRGGRQDRMIAVDMLLPPNSGRVSFPAHCVEAGRWTGRGAEDAKHFNKSDMIAVGNDLKIANASMNQSAVWENVKKEQEKLSQQLREKVNAPESESSLQLALENRTLQEKVAAFEAALKAAGESRKNVVGVVFVVNGQVTAAEVYGSNALFKKAWPKLLRSAATEAVAEKTAKQTPPAPSAKEVERLLACGGSNPAGQPGIADGTSNDVSASVDAAGARLEATQRAQRRGDLEAAPIGQVMIEGRGGATRSVLLRNSGGSNEAANRGPDANPADRPRSGTPYPYLEGVGVLQINPTGNNDAVNRGAQPAPQQNDTRMRAAIYNVTSGLPNRPAVPQPVNPDGNRLNVNRVDNPNELVTESRDPGRGNAVIHRSYLKK
jgi:hypothetical protein